MSVVSDQLCGYSPGADSVQKAGAAAQLHIWQAAVWVLTAGSAFYLAYLVPQAAYLSAVYLFGLVQLARAETWRRAFYSGLMVGLLTAAVRLTFFWQIFGAAAMALWLVYAVWIGAFVALARLSLRRLPSAWGWLLIPVLWCGQEYFRSELYYLRFSWLTPGLAFGAAPWLIPVHRLGAYGIGGLLMCAACIACRVWMKSRIGGLGVLALVVTAPLVAARLVPAPPDVEPLASVHVAGVQMEFPTESELLGRLNQLIRAEPAANLLVLSEYTLDGPVPERIRQWCRTHKRYLIAGGKEPAGTGNFYDTAYVVSPEGEIVFQQAKSVPIQFFKDGLPAQEQKLWDSPWGKIGICICYDLSYSRVTDELVREGAQALIVPTMDVVDWGVRQHELHALVAPIRASEYGLPIFRVASSGISQLVDARGRVKATAPCPGEGATISGRLEIRGPGRLPYDRWLGPTATTIAAGFLLLSVVRRRQPRPASQPTTSASER